MIYLINQTLLVVPEKGCILKLSDNTVRQSICISGVIRKIGMLKWPETTYIYIYIYISSVYSPFSDGVVLPLHT